MILTLRGTPSPGRADSGTAGPAVTQSGFAGRDQVNVAGDYVVRGGEK